MAAGKPRIGDLERTPWTWDDRGRSALTAEDVRREIAQILPLLGAAGLTFAFVGDPVVRVEGINYG
jgi:hypothetical protein